MGIKKSGDAGFTMVEMMIALFVTALIIAGYVGANIMMQRNSEDMHQRTVAIQNANQAIEQMRDVSSAKPFPASVVLAYPDGGQLTGFTSLTNEVVTVSYCRNETSPCPASATTTNPLDVTVTVAWESYTGRQRTESVRTYITQR
ncbi:MAG TPA: prepilin-type N-terminal cleavage/methylation domain-containing protein [Candidatus Omnitrophota bacterium]|nr:prepilin-type N-terminal cleavage/methylation domain-containing protein [Candidatus Omnitrophota bacterium]HPS36926.1 prepilin-type N-terminal cleavage/methylation domain-containing protein [Candidatus Omnitrophota bacterium]